MNKELLAKLYAKYNLQSVGTIEEFISDMQNPSVQEKFFNKYGLNKTGTIDEFRKDLGYTNPTAEKYNFEYNPDDPKSMVKSAFLNTISSLEGASPDTIVGGTKTNDLSKHPNKIGFTYADGRVSTAAGSYQITGQTWNDINKTLNLPDFSENSQKIAATYLAETRYKQQTNGDLWEDLLSAKNDPKKLTEIKNKLGSTWTPLAGKDDEFLKNYLGYNGIDNLFKKQNSALIDDNNKNIINTANIDRVTTLRNIYLESEKEARSTKEVAPRFSKNDALINAEDYVGKIDPKKAKEIFYSKIDPTQYTEEEIFDAMNPGVRSGILEKGRIVDQKNKEEESERGILNTIGERVAAIFLDDPEVIDGKYNIADRTISETMNPAESIKNDLSFTRDQLLAKDQNGKYTLDNSIDSLNLSQNEKLKLKDKSKRIRERLLTKENAEYNVKTSALEVGMDVVNYHLKTVKENMKQELGDEKMATIESVSKNPNATQEDIQAFQEIVSSSKYKDEYIKLLDKSSEFGNKFNSLPPVYKESLFLKKQSEKLQTEYDQYLADRGTKFQIFNSLSRFSNDLVPSIASSIVESGAAIVGTAIEATTGADLNATKYLIDQSANTRSIRSSKENLGGLYQAAEFTDQLGNKYKTTFDEDGNVQDIYYENGVKHYTEDRFTDTLYTLAESLNKKKELYQNRDNYNFSGLGMLDQGLESAKDIVGMMIPFGGALGITAKGAKLAKNASALSKGLNALKKVATSERAREFGSSMMMFADNFAEEAINEGIVDPAGISSYTAAKTTLECLTEMVFPFATKMSDDLGRVLNRTPSGTNTNAGNIVSNYLQKRFGNNWVKVLADGVPPGLLTDFTKTLKNIGADAISEGAEELMVEAANPFVNAALNNSGLSSVHLDEDWGNATEWGNSFLVGAFMGGVLGTGRTGLKGISQGKDLFNKEARYYNYVKEGLKSTLANKEVTDHFINSLEGKKPKEEIDRLRKIIDNTRKDASYILENENPNSSLADNLLTTAFELNMQREGRSFGKLPQTIKEEEKTTFLERKLSELNKNVALGSKTEINIADILSHPSTTIIGEKDGKVSKVDIKRAYRDLSEADINKLIEETHDKVFSESNVKKQSNLFLQKEYTKELLSGFNKLVKQENKLNEEDTSFSVEEVENPIDRKEDAEDVKAKKVENTKLNTDELKQEKIRLNQELSGYTTSEEYNAAYNSESDPVLKSFIREHQEARANTQKKGIELEDGSNKLTKAEQLNNDNLPRRYGASKLFEAKETREVGDNLKKVIESNPNYKSEIDKIKKNASYQTNVPELKGLFNYINGIYMLESDQDPSITPDTFDTDKAINEYYSNISNFNNDTNLQSAIDNYNKNIEVQEEKPVEIISDLEKQQIVTYTNLQNKIKQGGPWRYDTIIANIEKAYNDNVLSKDQHDVLVNLANEKNNRLKGNSNKSEVSKQEPVKSKREVNAFENIITTLEDVKNTPLETFTQQEFAYWLQNNIDNLANIKRPSDAPSGFSPLISNSNSRAIYDILTARPENRIKTLLSTNEKVDYKKEAAYYEKFKNKIYNLFTNSDSNGGWFQLNFGNQKNTEKDGLRRKGYITVSKNNLDLFTNNLSDILSGLNVALQEKGYNGSFKVSTSLGRLVDSFDNIVIHGANEQEVDKALEIINDYLTKNNIENIIAQKGKDGNLKDGSKSSHTQILAESVRNKEVKNPKLEVAKKETKQEPVKSKPEVTSDAEIRELEQSNSQIKVKQQLALEKLERLPETNIDAIKQNLDDKTSNGENVSAYSYFNKLYKRISNVLNRTIPKNIDVNNSLVIGNFVDTISRLFFNNENITYNEFIKELSTDITGDVKQMSRMTGELQFNQTISLLKKIKQELEAKYTKNGIKPIFKTKEFFLHVDGIFPNNKIKINGNDTTYSGIAGTTDMIVIDGDGELHIIDFKSSTPNSFKFRAQGFEGGPSNIDKWTEQLSEYSDILKNALQLEYSPKIGVVNIEVNYTKDTSINPSPTLNSINNYALVNLNKITNTYTSKLLSSQKTNANSEINTQSEETKVETPVTFDTPVVQTMNFFRSTVGKPGGESSIIVKYTREDGSFGITTIPIDTWKKMRSSNLDKFEIKDENGNILTGKVTYQEWINENVVRNPDTKKNIEDELRKTNVAQTILKEDDTVYYEVNFENYNGTDSALPKRKFEIVVVAYYKDGKIVKADTVGATRAIVGTLINNPDTPEGDTLSEKDPVRNLLYPYYLNKEVKQIPVKVAGKNNRISYHKGEWRSLEPTEIEKYEFDVVIQPFQGSNIGLAQDAKENSDEFKKSDTNIPLGENSVGKVIAKIPSGVPGEFIGVELNTPMLKDFPNGQDTIRNTLNKILTLANTGNIKEAEDLMRRGWVKNILNTLAYRTPFSTFDAMRQYKGETQQNPRGGKGPIILFPIKSAGKTYHTFVVKTKTGEPLDLSIDEILDFLGDTRVHVPNNQDALKKFINENPTALKTDLALPIETDNTTFPVVFNNSTVTLQPIEPNTEKSNIKEDTTPVRRSFKEGEKARFKISENTEEYTSTSAENYIRKRFEEVGVAVSDASLNILRKVYEVGDRKIWGAFHKAIVYLSSEAGELTGKHEGWHVLFGLFTTPEHKIRLYKEAFKKYGNELGISKEEFENALSQFTTNKDALFSTENDFYSTLDILDRIEEAMARDAETFKVTGVLSEEFKDKYPTIYKLFNDILNFIYDSYLRLQPYIPYLANRSNLNSLYYQMDKNYFGRGFNGKRLSRYKNIFRINYNNLYSQNEPRFSVEGLSTKEAKEYAEFVIDKLLRNIIQDKFDGYRSLTRSLKDAEDATKMLNESWQYIDEYARYYVEDNEIKNVDKELQTLSRIKNDPDFKLLALSRLNHITGYAADLEGIVEDSNTENENEDNTAEESSEKIIIRNSNVDVTKKISGKLREMLTLLHKKDKNGDFILSGPFSTYSTYDYTEVYKRLYQYLTDIPDNKLMWKTLIKHSSTYPYFREIAEYIFDQLVSRNNIPGYEGQSLNDYISDENLSSILEDNIYKSELFSLMFKRFGDQTSHQYIQTIVKSDGSVNLMYVNKENIDDNIRDEMDSHFSTNPQLFPEVITQNDLSDLYSKFGLLVTDDELANLTKKEIELLIEDFTKLGAKVKELISKGEIPAKSVLKNSGITYIMKSYNKLKPNLTNNVTRTIKNDLQFNIGYSNYINRLMSKTKSNAAYYRDRMKKDIFAKYLPAWRDMLVNTKNLDGIGWEILTDTGSKLTPGEMGKEYHELTKRELKILNINNFNAIGYQTSKDVVVANPIYSDATVHTYMKVPRIDEFSIVRKLALTALSELSRIEYHSKNKSDSKYWNENGGNFLLLGFLNGEIEIEVTENGNKQKQKVNGKEYFLNKYRSLLEDGNLPEARVQDMVSSLSLPISVMMENEFNKYLTSLVELGIISPERTLIKGVLSSQVGKEGTYASAALLDNFYNQVYYNTQFIGVIGGDPAYYSPNKSPRKSEDTLENYIHIDIDHLKRMKAWHSPNSRGVYIDEFGREKTTKKVLYLKDEEVPSSDVYTELIEHHGIKGPSKHSLTDAQGYNNPLFHLMVLQANAKITPEERTELQKRFININQKEDGSLSKTWKKGTFKKKDDKKNGIKSIMDIIKPFYAGHVEMILDENGNTSNVPFTEKSSEKGILIDEAYRLKDKDGNPTTISVPEGNPSKEYFNKYLNPTLAKMLWVMQQGEIDSIAFDTTLKIYNPTAKTMSIDEFMDSSVDDILKNTLELPLEGYGDQQEIPVEKHKAKNTHEGSQTAAIFMGRGNAEQKEALNEIIKHAVDDKIKKWKLDTATIADIGKKLRTNAVKQNKDSHTIDGYSLHPDGNLVAPLAYPSMRKINEAALNALAKGNIHEEIKGGSLINTSAIGMSDKLKIVKGENGTIKHVECAMAPHHPLIITLVNEYGVVTPEMVIEAYGKEVADGLLNFMAYRIPTEGAYSIYKLKVKYFLPDGSGAQIMLPAEATSITGLDFDIDKMYALYKTVTSNFDIEELRGVYQTYLDANEIDTEIDNDVARQIYNLVLNNNDIETTGDETVDYLIQLLYNYTRSNFDQFKELVKSHELIKPGLDTKEARNNKKLAIYDEIMQTESWAKEFLQGGSAELLKETIAEVDKIYPNTSNRVYEIATPTHQEENAEKATEGGRSIGAFANAVKHHNYTSDTEIKLLRPITIFDTSYNGIGESLWETINVSGWYVAKVLSSLLFASTENIKNPLLSAMGLKDTNRDTVIAAIRLGIPLNQVITLLRHPIVENIFNSSKDPINDIRALYTNLLDKYELKEAPPSVSFDEYKKLISETLNNKDSDMLLLSILDNIITLSDIGDELFTIQSISKFDTEDSFKPDLNLTFNKLLKIADRRYTSEKYLSGNSYFGNPFFDDQDVLNILPNVSYNDAEGVFEFERKDIPGGVNSLNEYTRVAVEEINHYKDNLPHFGPSFKAIRSDIQEQLASKRLSNKQIEIINNAIYAFIGQTELSDKLSILPNFGQIFAKVKSSEFAKKYPFTFAYLNTKFINGVSFVSKSGRPFDSEIMVKIKDEMSAMINDNTKLGLEDNPNYNGIEFAENLLFYGFVKSKFSFNFEGFAEIAPIDMLQNPDPNNIGNRIREVFKMDKDKVSTTIANIPNFSTKILVKHPELARHVGKEDFTAPETQILYHGMPIDPVIQIKQDDNIVSKYKTSDENEPFLPYIRNTYYSSNESERRVPNLRVLYKHESNGKYVAVINKTDPRVYTIYEGGFRLHESIKDTNITKPVVNSITPSNTPESNINETLRVDNKQNVNTEVNNNKIDLTPRANIPQNLVSGVEAFGTKQEANEDAKKRLGSSPHSIDMVEAGIRTRTTRSVGEMEKYNIKVGDIVKQFGKSADGTTKNILTKVTAIYHKGTPGFLGTWNKEGWTQEGIEAIKRFKDGAAAIEFEVVKQNINNQPAEVNNVTNNQNIQLQGNVNNKKLFNPNDKSLKKGSIVDYNGSMYLFWNENSSGKAQLIKTDGTKASATPNIDKLKVIGSYPIVQYNNNEYIVTDNNNIYSGSTGNLVYNGNDNSSKVQKERIINSVRNNNTSEETFSTDIFTENNLVLNKDQELALSEILDFFNDSNRKTHSLIGYAGTGKTTLLNIVKDQLKIPFNDIIFSSPTHRANAVIKLKNKNAKVYTLHQLLGLSMEQDLEKFNIKDAKFVQKNDTKINGGDILIIDEASMVNDDLFTLITKIIGGNDIKILYVGDDAQLKPVGQNHQSKALTSTEKQSKLTIVERADNNALLSESMFVRDTGNFSYTTNIQDNRGVAYTNNKVQFLTKAFDMFKSEEFKQNPLLLRILSGTNAVVADTNSKIREALFSNSAKEYEVGDIIMGYGNWKTDYNTKQPILSNGGDYRVISSEVGSQNIAGKIINGFNIELQNILDKDQKSFSAFVISKNTPKEDLFAIGQEYEKIRQQASKSKGPDAAILWKKLADLKDSFISPINISDGTINQKTGELNVKISKTIDYGYAHTIHKSQGGTYKYSFIIDSTIDSFSDINLRKQLRYVAITRSESASFVLKQAINIKTDFDLDINEELNKKKDSECSNDKMYNIDEIL
jgi:muramidase (phage lysozyme)/soluble cytochrome b562